MKVDLGTCAVCGAKNSKFVEKCYKCGAALPWAPGYVAPKTPVNTPSPTSQPKPQPKPVPPSNSPRNDPKTVVSPPLDLSEPDKGKTSLPGSVSERAKRSVSIPAWAIGLGGAGCVALGVALMMAFGNRSTSTPAVVPVSATPAPTVAATPTETAIPTTAVAPPAATASATAVPTSVPVATIAPTIAPTVIAPTAVPVAQSGPAFDALYLNTTSGTKDQKDAYWKTVENTKVSWRGDFVSLGTAPEGPLVIRCKRGSTSALVTISLNTSPPQTLPPLQTNQSVAVEGVLKSYSAQGYELVQGRIS